MLDIIGGWMTADILEESVFHNLNEVVAMGLTVENNRVCFTWENSVSNSINYLGVKYRHLKVNSKTNEQQKILFHKRFNN